ncbi:hypothetical protein GCM10023238_18110 [Streptomyces heliomycini]
MAALGGGALPVGAGEGDLDVGEELPGAGGHGPGDGGLVAQPGPALFGTRACLAFRAGGAVQ